MALTLQQKEEIFAVIRDLQADGLGRKAVVDVLIDDHEISMASAYRYWQEAQPKDPQPLQDNPGKIALEALLDLLRAAQARDDAEAVQSLAKDIANISAKLKLTCI
jgi:DNA-binding GntR family transcriptional regulator